jgi:hypothetical protein
MNTLSNLTLLMVATVQLGVRGCAAQLNVRTYAQLDAAGNPTLTLCNGNNTIALSCAYGSDAILHLTET